MGARKVALICFFDPEGISTVTDTIQGMKRFSAHDVTIVNLFAQCSIRGEITFPQALDIGAFDAIILHNTIAYNVANLRTLDRHAACKMREYKGIKILMKQDENYRFREMAEYMGEVGFDIVFTCLPEAALPLVYPPEKVGNPRFIRMLTGYVTPELRARGCNRNARNCDIFYRGSLQPLGFGRLAYEKRAIGDEVAARLGEQGLTLDISSRWEDRIGGDAWFDALAGAKATLGVESGASIFDLDGTLAMRCAEAEKALGPLRDDAAYAEAYLGYLAPIEDKIYYHQIAPRHFEAAAMGTQQWLFPGEYSGIFVANDHYVPLARDFSNLEEAAAMLHDDARREAMTARAYRDIIENPAYGIERFVATCDAAMDEKAAVSSYIPMQATPCGTHIWRMAARRLSHVLVHNLKRYVPGTIKNIIRKL